MASICNCVFALQKSLCMSLHPCLLSNIWELFIPGKQTISKTGNQFCLLSIWRKLFTSMQKECSLQFMHLESTVNRYCAIVCTLMWLVSWYPLCLPWTKCKCLKWPWILCLGFWGAFFVLGYWLGILWIGPAVSNATQNNWIRYFSLTYLEMAENLSGNGSLNIGNYYKQSESFVGHAPWE